MFLKKRARYFIKIIESHDGSRVAKIRKKPGFA